MSRFDSAIAALEEERYEKAQDLDRIDRVISDLRSLNGGAATSAPKVRKVKKAKAGKAKAAGKRGKGNPKREKALKYWNAGKELSWMAKKLGVTVSGLNYWKRVDNWPHRPEKREDLESEDD